MCRGRGGPRAGLGGSPEPAGAAPPSRRGLPAPRLPTASGPHRAGVAAQSPSRQQSSLRVGTHPGAALWAACLSVCLLLPLSEGHLCSPPPFSLPKERFPAGGGGAEQGNGCQREVAQIPASLPPAQGLLRRPFPHPNTPPPPPCPPSLSPPPPPGQGKHVTSRWSWEAGGRETLRAGT